MAADWATQAADALEHAVAAVREKTVVPAQKATRAVVFGLLVTFFVATAVTLLVIGGFRGLVILTGEVWLAYVIVGGILVVAGALLWRLRLQRPGRADRKQAKRDRKAERKAAKVAQKGAA
jgi:hypothetical protein